MTYHVGHQKDWKIRSLGNYFPVSTVYVLQETRVDLNLQENRKYFERQLQSLLIK